VAAGAASRPARGDDAPAARFRLVWVRGERTDSCADGDAIRSRVTQRLGKDVFGEPAGRSIESVLQHEGDDWEVHIYVRAAGGQLAGSRMLTSHGPTCSAIEAAATLAIVLAIDPDGAIRASTAASTSAGATPVVVPSAPTPSPGAVPCPTVPAPIAPPAPLCPAPPPAPPPPPPCPTERPCPTGSLPASSVTLDADAVVAFGLLPGVAPGVAIGVEVPVAGWLRATGGMRYLPEQEQHTSVGQFGFGMTSGWLGPCVRPRQDAVWGVSLCARAEVGAIHSVVYSLTPVLPGEKPWAGASVGGGIGARVVGPLRLTLHADMVVPITREPFVVQGQSVAAFQQAAATAVVGIGAGMSFP
jgi:hypothetical protein